MIAYICGIALPFPGFAATLGATGVGQAGADMFYIGWLLSFFTALVVYTGLCKIWPTKNQKLIRERGMAWEECAHDQIEDDTSSSAQEMGYSHDVVSNSSKKDGAIIS